MNLASGSVHLGGWDLALLAVVSAQATAVAYLHQPRWKVLLMSLPLPFTLGSLALGRPVDVTHIAGVVLLLGFTHGIRYLNQKLRLAIVPAIAASALAYCAAGAAGARFLPRTATAFWLVAGLAMAAGGTLYAISSHREEPGHRSPLPLWIKLPAVAGVILALVLAKQLLSGFMALFPMMGVVTAYEARHSLWAVCRQIHVVILALAPMVTTVWLLQGPAGRGLALLAGWGAFLLVLAPLTWNMWFAAAR